MAKEEKVLTNKEKEAFKKAALKELNDDIKSELVDSVVKDVKKELDKVVKDVEESIDVEYKEELKTKLTDELSEDIKDRIKKDEDRLNRSKSWKIFRRDILIVLLLICSCFLVYVLYNNDELNSITDGFNKIIGKTTTTTTTTTKLVKDNAWYINEYGYLMDKINVNNYEVINKNINVEKLDNSNLLAMAYLNVSEDKITKDGILYQVSSVDVEEEFKKLFNVSYKPSNFTVDNINYVYSSKNDSYIAMVEEVEVGFRVINNIISISENNNDITIKCSAYLEKDNEIYSIDNLKETGVNITLKTVSYVFTNVDGNYLLTRIIA